MRGDLLRKIDFGEVEINMHVVDGNRIIATNNNQNTIVQISLDGSDLKQLIDTSPMTPAWICINHKGNIVVMCRGDDYNALVEYSPDGKYKIKKFVRDGTGSRLLPDPLRVIQNGNTDYIVTNEFTVVAVSSEGKLRWRFSGKGLTKRTSDYRPDALCCDRFNNVIVGDYLNDMVDILDSDGGFVTCLLSRDHGVEIPYALATDEQDNLWIGSDVKEKIIVASYLK